MRIDPHVHCRDGRQSHKETVEHVFEIAQEQGIDIIFDMPNTDPPLLSEESLKQRLKLVPRKYRGKYFIYLGLTREETQIKEVLRCYSKYPEVIGFKMYAGHSTGQIGIGNKDDQNIVYAVLAKKGYSGVLAVHCEKESLFYNELWNPEDPITHTLVRPKQAEIESVKDQIYLAEKNKFQGTLHIVHVSCPETVNLVYTRKLKNEKLKNNKDSKKKDNILKITCGATPHHLLWDKNKLNGSNGLLYKTNPPLRSEIDVQGLRKCLKENKIDWIETDHAPHTLAEKLYAPYLSGYASLYLYGYLIKEFLPQKLGLSKKQIKDLTFNNIYSVFKEKLKKMKK